MKTVQRSPSRVGFVRAERQPREFALDADAELLRLLFQERPGARRAGLVHGEIHHHAVLDRDELRILPADFEDGVHRLAAQRAADVDRAGLVRRDLVVHHIGAHELRDQLAARLPVVPTPRISRRLPHMRSDLGQPLLHRLDGPARGAQIDVVNHRAELVDRPPRWWRRTRCRVPR